MADSQNELPPGTWFFPLPFGGPVRSFFRRHSAIVHAAEFAIVVGLMAGAWFAGSDMFRVVPALVVAFIIAVAGLAASDLSTKSAVIGCAIVFVTLVGEGGILFWHASTWPYTESIDLAKQLKQDPRNREKVFEALTAKWTQLIEANKAIGNPADRSLVDEKMREAFAAVVGNAEARVVVNPSPSLIILLSYNTFLVLNPVVMRVAPNLMFPTLPAGVRANVLENSSVGFIVAFTPPTVPISRLPTVIANAEP